VAANGTPGTPPAAEGQHALASIIRGMAVGLLASIVGGGLGFVFPVVMAHLLDSQARFGLLILALNLLSSSAALSIASTDVATVRYVAAARTPGAKRGAMVTPLILALSLNVVVAVVVFVFARPLAGVVISEERYRSTFADVLRVLVLVLPLTVLAQMLSSCLSGLERVQGELARKTFEMGLRIVFGAGAVVAGFGLVGAVFGMVAAAGAAATAVAILLWRVIPRGGKTERISVGRVVTFAWPQAIARGSVEVAFLALLFLLGHSTEPRTVGLYGAAFAIAAMPSLIYNSFSYRFMPAISRLWEHGEIEELRELLQGVTRWVTMMSVPLYAVAISIPAALLHVYGKEYTPAATALAVITLSGFVNSVTGPVSGALIMTGRVKLDMASNIAACTTQIVLASILIPHYGLTGAAISIAAYGTVLNGLKLLFVYLTLHTTTMSAGLIGPLVAAAAAGAGCAVLAHTTPLGHSLGGAVILSFALIAAYAVLLFRVVGISSSDRSALRLAVRPGG
jgi:O-antigen/teichoic acid export membrane protein